MKKKQAVCLALILFIPLVLAGIVLWMIGRMQNQVDVRKKEDFSPGNFIREIQWQGGQEQADGSFLVEGELWLCNGAQEYWLPTHSYQGKSYSLDLHGAVEDSEKYYLMPTRIELPQGEPSSLDPENFGPCSLQVLIPNGKMYELYQENGLLLTLENGDQAQAAREGSRT